MTLRRIAPAALLALVFIASATFADERHETENFIVSAPNKQLAKQFGEYAERYRVEKAREWLGEEMPRWAKPCPLVVEINPRRTGGATTFTFSPRGGVASQDMKIFGETRQLLESVLPHEVTHTVLAHHFGTPVPRWADEGGSVLSENDKERLEHDIKCREFLNASRGIPLRHLFPMKNYPSDTIVLYAQGFSVSNYLIDLGGAGLKGRRKFLEFLETGMARDGRNWEAAVAKHYSFANVDDLQEKWIESLRTPPVARGKAADDLRKAVATSDTGRRAATATADVRSTASLGIPQLEQPVVNAIRAAAPSHEADKQSPRASEWKSGTPAGRDPSATAVPRLLAPEIPSK